jgi:hypothetical protein
MSKITVTVTLGYYQQDSMDKISVAQTAMLHAYEDHAPWTLVRPLKRFTLRDDLPDHTLSTQFGPLVDCIIIERGTEAVVGCFSVMPLGAVKASAMQMLNALALPPQLGERLLAAKT